MLRSLSPQRAAPTPLHQLPIVLAMLAAAGAMLAGMLGTGSARAQAAPDPGIVSFGHELADLAARGDIAGLVYTFESEEVVCPGDTAYPAQACEGLEDGATAHAYSVGVYHSEGGLVSAAGLETALSGFIDTFASSDIRLYTVADAGYGDCTTCSLVVLSTPADADTADGSATVLTFELRDTGAGLIISSVIGGQLSDIHGDELNTILGGTTDGRTFTPVTPDAAPSPTTTAEPTRDVPNPPNTGSGLQPDGAGTPIPAGLFALSGVIIGTLLLTSWRRRVR